MAPFDAVPYAQFNAWALQLKILCQSTWFSQCIGLWRPVWMLGNVSFRLVGKMDARLLGQGCLRENLPVLETWSSNVQKFSRSKSWNCGRFGRLSYTHLSAFRFSLSGCNHGCGMYQLSWRRGEDLLLRKKQTWFYPGLLRALSLCGNLAGGFSQPLKAQTRKIDLAPGRVQRFVCTGGCWMWISWLPNATAS